MRRTVLDMTQNILSALGSDEVNSISDTTESLQVAEILKTSFFNLSTRLELPRKTGPFQLNASTDPTQPVLMYRPDNVAKLEWIKYYDASVGSVPQYKYVTILPNEQFIDMINCFNSTETDVGTFAFTVAGESFNFLFKTDKQPQYCTVIQNYYIVFDGYDNTLDSTLQSSKTLCYGLTQPSWTSSDTFIPDLDDAQFPLLLNEAKSLAFIELKQMTHSKAEQENKRQWSSLQKAKATADKPSSFDQLPNFGRN